MAESPKRIQGICGGAKAYLEAGVGTCVTTEVGDGQTANLYPGQPRTDWSTNPTPQLVPLSESV